MRTRLGLLVVLIIVSACGAPPPNPSPGPSTCSGLGGDCNPPGDQPDMTSDPCVPFRQMAMEQHMVMQRSCQDEGGTAASWFGTRLEWKTGLQVEAAFNEKADLTKCYLVGKGFYCEADTGMAASTFSCAPIGYPMGSKMICKVVN